MAQQHRMAFSASLYLTVQATSEKEAKAKAKEIVAQLGLEEGFTPDIGDLYDKGKCVVSAKRCDFRVYIHTNVSPTVEDIGDLV